MLCHLLTDIFPVKNDPPRRQLPRIMGGSLSKLFSGLIWGKKDIRILILGLVRLSPGTGRHVLRCHSDTVYRTTLAKLPCSTG